MNHFAHTIVSVASATGVGAIAIIRLSGKEAITIVQQIFVGKKELLSQKGYTVHYGNIVDGTQFIDDVIINLFKAPHSYTGEDTVEISCHASTYITKTIVQLCIAKGATLASAGEYTQRAFLNGKLDLSQAESVAAIIAAENKSQHQLAISQMRGGYAEILKQMREELIAFTALIELELDFSEEDVAFADRHRLNELLTHLSDTLHKLIASFYWGNAIKKGIPVAIVGAPNAGKSTLLNVLLNEDKALVSDIPGTTRDFIEDCIDIEGIQFRFIDTAGLRHTQDTIESMGISRSYEKMKQAHIVLYLCDIQTPYMDIVNAYKELPLTATKHTIILLNKSDTIVDCNAYDIEEAIATLTKCSVLEISAKTGRNIALLKKKLQEIVAHDTINYNQVLLQNERHLVAMQSTLHHIQEVAKGLSLEVSGDLLTPDIKMALYHLGTITGHVEIDRDILGTIFSKFCIGK